MVELTYEEYETVTNTILNLDQAIQRVRELHSYIEENNSCNVCWRTYPCATIKALDGVEQ